VATACWVVPGREGLPVESAPRLRANGVRVRLWRSRKVPCLPIALERLRLLDSLENSSQVALLSEDGSDLARLIKECEGRKERAVCEDTLQAGTQGWTER